MGPSSRSVSLSTGSTRYSILDRYTGYNAARRPRRAGGLALLAKRAGSAALGRLVPLLTRSPQPDPCDVLFVHGWSAGPASLQPLTEALEQQGLRVRHHVRDPRGARLRRRLFGNPGQPVPPSWRLDAHYAAYLLQRYAPRVVVLFENYSPFASVLRAVAGGGVQSVNLSHSVTPPGDEANMFDFDYYFVFGPSSVDHSRGKRIRIGSTRLVQTGYMWIPPDFILPPSTDRRTILFFSQLSDELLDAPDVSAEDKALVRRNTTVVCEFARKHPDIQLLVRLHPLERPDHVLQLSRGLPNVRVLDPGVGMKAAVSQASLAVVMWSNASIEAAVLGRPLVMVNDSDRAEEYLELEQFFLPRARTPDDLYDRVRAVYADYDRYRAQAARFVTRHLARTTEAVPFLAHALASVARGRPDFEWTELPECLEGLTSAGEAE